MRGESVPIPPEMEHFETEDHDTDGGSGRETTLRQQLETEAPCPTLDRARELAKHSIPNTITFIPHGMRNKFATVYCTKLKDLAYFMRVADDTQGRERHNLLVWAIPALILSEDESGTELRKEHSRAAELKQRLADLLQDPFGTTKMMTRELIATSLMTKSKLTSKREQSQVPPAVGDIIMEPLGAPTADAGSAGAEHSIAPPTPGLRVELLRLHLPPDRGFACSQPTRCSMFPPAVACARSPLPRSAGKAWPEAVTFRWRLRACGASAACEGLPPRGKDGPSSSAGWAGSRIQPNQPRNDVHRLLFLCPSQT